jgi:hypothetical protein
MSRVQFAGGQLLAPPWAGRAGVSYTPATLAWHTGTLAHWQALAPRWSSPVRVTNSNSHGRGGQMQYLGACWYLRLLLATTQMLAGVCRLLLLVVRWLATPLYSDSESAVTVHRTSLQAQYSDLSFLVAPDSAVPAAAAIAPT